MGKWDTSKKRQILKDLDRERRFGGVDDVFWQDFVCRKLMGEVVLQGRPINGRKKAGILEN